MHFWKGLFEETVHLL